LNFFLFSFFSIPGVPEVIQLSKQEDLERECLSKVGGICVIALLPESDESYPPSIEERVTHTKILTDVKSNFKQDTSVRFLWAEATATRELAKKLDLAETSGPSVFAVNPRRKVYRPFLGAFDNTGLKEWIDETKNGRGSHTFKYEFDLVLA
jgi:protein disulfide-isomerase A6